MKMGNSDFKKVQNNTDALISVHSSSFFWHIRSNLSHFLSPYLPYVSSFMIDEEQYIFLLFMYVMKYVNSFCSVAFKAMRRDFSLKFIKFKEVIFQLPWHRHTY